MAQSSTLRFGAQTDETTSLLRIVNLVRVGEATTRPAIRDVTGLGRGVVAQRVEEAMRLGYLDDADLAPSTGGRAARSLRFRKEAGLLLVCALTAQHLRVGLADLDGTIIDHIQRDWDITVGPERTLDVVDDLAHELLTRCGDGAPLWAVTVGLPGPVDFASGRPVAPPIMPGWHDFDVRGRFEQEFDAPTWVDNDVNLLALSERNRRGPDTDLIFCKVGTGLGAGLLSAGRLHRGANGAAGDIGHVHIPGGESRCRCGKTGCLEAEAGGWALSRRAEEEIRAGARTTLGDDTGHVRASDIGRAALDGDPLGITLATDSARLVGESVATLINMFNPSVIVLGGAISSAGEVFLAEVRRRVYEMSLPLATRDLSIVRSRGNENESLIGGVELARELLFEVTFPRWFAESRPSVASVRRDGTDSPAPDARRPARA